MDDELLAEARRAQGRLIDAERDADVARAEFNRAVRQLHLRGASLREVAGQFGLSHQRVYQIVQEAGGSRRWLRHRNDAAQRRELACTFCGREEPETAKLIAGSGVYICHRCVAAAATVIGTGEGGAGRLHPVPAAETRWRCSFCTKSRHQVAGMASGPARTQRRGLASVCTECLDLCREIIAEELGEPPRDPGAPGDPGTSG